MRVNVSSETSLEDDWILWYDGDALSEAAQVDFLDVEAVD